MSHLSGNIRLLQEISFEVSCFQSEGYYMVTCVRWDNLYFDKLRHHANGNEIVVRGNPLNGELRVTKNGKTIKSRVIERQDLSKV